jgi:hypothetical protein
MSDGIAGALSFQLPAVTLNSNLSNGGTTARSAYLAGLRVIAAVTALPVRFIRQFSHHRCDTLDP